MKSFHGWILKLTNNIFSLLLLGPALVLVTVLVQRAAHLDGNSLAINTMAWQPSLTINTMATFPLHLLSSLFLPLLGFALALSLLLARPYIHIRCSIAIHCKHKMLPKICSRLILYILLQELYDG